MKNEITAIDQVSNEIDYVVEQCLPITNQQAANFSQALVLAKGVKRLREIFQTNKDIQENVMAMVNTNLGFMTDRTPDAIRNSKNKKKELVPYTYSEISECCIEAMLNGYRITNNEFNIITGRFYAAKNGKHRRIVENEKISNFKFSHTPPLFCTEERKGYNGMETVQVAKVQCFASWMQDGNIVILGDDRDKLVFKIKVNYGMGDDGVVGKALSKLFTRVLMRLDGNIIPESTDIEPSIDLSPDPNKLLNGPKIEYKDIQENPLHKTEAWKRYAESREIDPVFAATMPEPTTEKQCEEATKAINQNIDKNIS